MLQSSVEVEQASQQKKRVNLHRHMRGMLPIFCFICLWEVLARLHIFSPVLFPSFVTVIKQLILLAIRGHLLTDVITSSFRAAAGLGLAIVIGVIVGLSMARIKPVNWFFEPLIALGFPMPTIMLIPVFILWFGISHESKIFLIAFTCFFPIALSTATGVRTVNKILIWSAKALGTPEQQIFWRIILPAALPFIFSGIRITLPLSLILAFVAEMVGGGGGLGYSMIYAYRFLETPTVYSILLTVLVLGFFLDRALLSIRQFIMPWDSEDIESH